MEFPISSHFSWFINFWLPVLEALEFVKGRQSKFCINFILLFLELIYAVILKLSSALNEKTATRKVKGNVTRPWGQTHLQGGVHSKTNVIKQSAVGYIHVTENIPFSNPDIPSKAYDNDHNLFVYHNSFYM